MAAVFLSAVLFGCASSTKITALPEQPPVGDSDTVVGAVYLDGSMSMQGFVNFPTSTEYVDAIKNIEQALTLGWKNEKIAYYRFGDRLARINDDDRLSFAGHQFYGDLLTKLDVMVEEADSQSLSFIVSDFLQSDQDFQKLVTAVKKKYFTADKGAALIGIKGRFKGAVYDIGVNKEKFYYYSGEDKNRFRPFYILVLGDQREVERFCKYYDQSLPKEFDRRIICMTDDLGNGNLVAEAVDYSKPADIKTYAAVDDILPSAVVAPQYQLKSRPGSIYLQYTLPQNGLAASDVQIKSSMDEWQEADKSFKKIMAVTAVKATAEHNNSGFTIRLDLRPEALPHSGIYRYGLLLRPENKEYRELQAAILKDWKMEDSFKTTDGGVFNIDTTLELKKFVRNLADVAYVSLRPHYEESYVYFRY